VEDITIVPYAVEHFEAIQELNKTENWTQLVGRNEVTRNAWKNSNVAYLHGST